MKEIFIFGAAEQAQLASYYFENHSDRNVAGFVVDDAFSSQNLFEGKPVLPMSEFENGFSPKDFDVFIALGYSSVNELRRTKYEYFKSLQFDLASYISAKATILNDFNIGDNAFILENNTIQPFVRIGNNVTLWSGNHIGHHSVIHDHTFVTSHVVVSGGVTIGSQCFLGVNSTIRDHISIGSESVVGAGSLIMKPLPEKSVSIPQRTLTSDFDSNRLKKL
jgi:sugar O-acyltransferase (sialic acid O-acetyltransferase NeuD family)